MTEHDWLTSDDPQAMLRWIMPERRGDVSPGGDIGRFVATARKLRLFACACCRLMRPQWCDREGLDESISLAEGFADHGHAMPQRVLGRAFYILTVDAILTADATFAAQSAVDELDTVYSIRAGKAALLRCLFGNPWRQIIAPIGDNNLLPEMPRWDTPVALGLARSIYDAHDFAAMPVLADALEEAGCPEMVCPGCGDRATRTKCEYTVCAACDLLLEPHPLLAHLRGPGGHARGCWALDCVLGKE